MKKIKVNGKEYEVEKNVTVLEFLDEIGIYVPRLCYHPKLRKVGSCRLCLVSDRGRYRNACSTYIEDGMDIQTHTQELEMMRKWIMQLLFSERNHYCMYCAVTNDCEFQRLGYYTGLDHLHFASFKNIFDADNSHPYILFDNNRCVLCTRCIRACSEVAGHSVLSVKNKGRFSMVVADGGVPLGQSSCTSCGLCVQVCPTGTLVDKYSMFLSRSYQTEKYRSHCFSCPVGCGIEIHDRKGIITKVYSDWDSFTKGLICYKGRYESVLEHRRSIEEKKYREIDLTRDLGEFKDHITPNSVAVVDGTLFNEEIEIIKKTFPKVVSAYQINPKVLENRATIDDLEGYQTYIVGGWDINMEYGALGSVLKRNVNLKGHKIIYLNGTHDAEKIKRQIVGKAIFIYKGHTDIKIDGVDELVLPLSTNDVGVLKIVGQSVLRESDVSSDTNIFVFSRELRTDLSSAVRKARKAFLFSFRINGFAKHFEEIYRIPSQYDVKGTFYNLFNQILSTTRERR